MRITSLFAAGLAVGVGAAVGCGPGKELPTKPPEPTEHRPVVPPAPRLPTQSEPAAKEVVARAIAAHTKNDPARLARLKVARVTMAGQWNTGGWIPVNRAVLAEWPDRYRCTLSSDAPTFRTTTLGYNGPTGTRRAGDDEVPLSPGDIQALRWDATAQLWVPLLVPLADPDTVVFGAVDGGVDGRPLKVVKASHPGYPTWTLGFDPASSLLVRLAYEGQEAGVPVQKTVALSEHAEKHGVMVPGKWEMFHGDKPVETSRLTEITFPDKVDPKEFTGP